MFCVAEKDILDVYKEEGKLQEYGYCVDYLRFMSRKTNKTIKDISSNFCVCYNVLLKWNRRETVPYGIKCLDSLKEKKLLPYYPNKTTARIVGFLHGDGYLYTTLLGFGFVSKDKDMLLKLRKDVEGEFKIKGKFKVKRDRGDIERINGKKYFVKFPNYELKFNSKAVGSLLFKLGVPRGKKIFQKVFVPNWIMEGGLDIQKAFLHGLFDSELSNAHISTFKGHEDNLANPRMEMGKEESLENNLKRYLNQIRTLLKSFGIESKVASFRRYNKKRISLTLFISNKLLNIYHFVDKVGFYYNQQRMLGAIRTKELALEKIKKKNVLYKVLKYSKTKNSFTLKDLEHDLDMPVSTAKILGLYLYNNRFAYRKRQVDRWFKYYPDFNKVNKIIENPLLLEKLPRLKEKFY